MWALLDARARPPNALRKLWERRLRAKVFACTTFRASVLRHNARLGRDSRVQCQIPRWTGSSCGRTSRGPMQVQWLPPACGMCVCSLRVHRSSLEWGFRTRRRRRRRIFACDAVQRLGRGKGEGKGAPLSRSPLLQVPPTRTHKHSPRSCTRRSQTILPNHAFHCHERQIERTSTHTHGTSTLLHAQAHYCTHVSARLDALTAPPACVQSHSEDPYRSVHLSTACL